MNMKWFGLFLSSTIGKKIIMSLTGLFLILFLIVHVSGNFLLFAGDGGLDFNAYSKFMTSNVLVRIISISLYFFILLHAVQGIYIVAKNKKARGSQGYGMKKASDTSWAARNMGLLGILIFAFLCLHMSDFWAYVHFSETTLDSNGNIDLYNRVVASFQNSWVVLAYIIGLIALAFHLYHGFDSAFKTLGFNHPKWTPIIKTVGTLFSIIVPLAFAIFPIIIYLKPDLFT